MVKHKTVHCLNWVQEELNYLLEPLSSVKISTSNQPTFGVWDLIAVVTMCNCHDYQFGHADVSDADMNQSPPWWSMCPRHADDMCPVGMLDITFVTGYGDMNVLCVFAVKKEKVNHI